MMLPRSLLLAGALLLLQSCGSSQAPAIAAGGDASRAVCSQLLQGEAPSADQIARMVQVRQKFFGAANVDAATGALRRDRFIASWVDVTGYAVAMDGHVLLWDAFVGDNSGHVPTDDCELSDLRPELLFVGHGHFDHAELVPTILNRSRSTIAVGSEELCVDLRAAAAGHFEPDCRVAMPAAAALGTIQPLNGLLPNIAVAALKHPHSDGTLPEDPLHPSFILPLPLITKPPGAGPCLAGCPALTTANAVEPSYTQDGRISLLYQFRYGRDFVVTWNNTNGPNQPGDPVLSAMSTLPATDLEFGSILGFNGITNGFLDARRIAEALRSRLLIPGHHDFLPLVSGKTFEPSLRSEFERTPAERRAGILFTSDPDDYLNPARLSWNPDAAIWAESTPLDETQGR